MTARYKVVAEADLDIFQEQVQKSLDDGYHTLHGNLAFLNGLWVQSMLHIPKPTTQQAPQGFLVPELVPQRKQ